MFEAWVAFCLISEPQECALAQDTFGPYNTFQECKVRAEVMAENIFTLPDHNPVAWKCEDLRGEPA